MGVISAETAIFGQSGARQVTRTSDGDLHCFWLGGGNIRYAYGTDGGGWTVVGDILTSAQNQTSPAVCTDGTDCYIAWLESGKVNAGSGAGASWTDHGVVTASYGTHGSLALAIDNTGRLHLAFVGEHPTEGRDVVYLFYSDTGGVSWTYSRMIHLAIYVAQYAIQESREVSLSIDNSGNPIVAFTRKDASDSYFKLDCRGEGFWDIGEGEYVPMNARTQGLSNVAMDSYGTIHLVFTEEPAEGLRQIRHAIKTSPGITSFQYVGTIAASSYEQVNPQIAIGDDGRVYCCWQENEGGNIRLRYAYYIQEFSTWIDLGYINTPQGFSEYGPRVRWARYPASDNYMPELNVLWTGGGDTYHTAAALPTVAVSIVSPNGGQVWGVGTFQQVRWAAYGASIDHLELDYSIDGGNTWTSIDPTIDSSDTEYDWTVPNTPSDRCKVRVVAKDAGDVTIGSGESMRVFSI